MPSTPTTRNRFEKQGTGENANTWGTLLNTNTIDLIDSAIDGMASYALSGAKVLTSTNYAADEARMAIQSITSGTGGTVTIPGVQKWYLVKNASSGTVTFTTGSGTTAVIAAGDQRTVVCDGTNVYNLRALDYGAELPVSSATPTLSTQLVPKSYVDGLSFSSSLPAQTGNAGKYVTTDGTTASWAAFTSATVGLGNVNNTSDAAKPVSTAQQTALDLKANTATTISPGTGLTGGGSLAANRTLTANIASQAEAEAGASTTTLMTPQRTSQAVTATMATQAEAEAGVSATKLMTPLRTAQALAAIGPNWTLLSTTTIGGATATVTQTGLTGYADILIVATNVSHDAGVNANLRIAYSSDGTSFGASTAISALVAAASTVLTTAFVTSGEGNTHCSASSSEIAYANAALVTTALSAIRLSWSSGNFDAGSVKIYAR